MSRPTIPKRKWFEAARKGVLLLEFNVRETGTRGRKSKEIIPIGELLKEAEERGIRVKPLLDMHYHPTKVRVSKEIGIRSRLRLP